MFLVGREFDPQLYAICQLMGITSAPLALIRFTILRIAD